ncbi:MAG: DUF1934 domain-containing protein [Roseburia sp.]|nr:DUF1934 domain-containing protein [Roseburia sp.]
MKYSLEIIQKTDGAETVTRAVAEGKISGGALELCYPFDGAEYRLIIKSGEIYQLRTGGVRLEMRFAAGKKTKCFLADGGNCGAFEIITKKLSVNFSGANVFAECGFCYAGDGGLINLTVVANALQ